MRPARLLRLLPVRVAGLFRVGPGLALGAHRVGLGGEDGLVRLVGVAGLEREVLHRRAVTHHNIMCLYIDLYIHGEREGARGAPAARNLEQERRRIPRPPPPPHAHKSDPCSPSPAPSHGAPGWPAAAPGRARIGKRESDGLLSRHGLDSASLSHAHLKGYMWLLSSILRVRYTCVYVWCVGVSERTGGGGRGASPRQGPPSTLRRVCGQMSRMAAPMA